MDYNLNEVIQEGIKEFQEDKDYTDQYSCESLSFDNDISKPEKWHYAKRSKKRPVTTCVGYEIEKDDIEDIDLEENQKYLLKIIDKTSLIGFIVDSEENLPDLLCIREGLRMKLAIMAKEINKKKPFVLNKEQCKNTHEYNQKHKEEIYSKCKSMYDKEIKDHNRQIKCMYKFLGKEAPVVANKWKSYEILCKEYNYINSLYHKNNVKIKCKDIKLYAKKMALSEILEYCENNKLDKVNNYKKFVRTYFEDV